MNTLTSFPVWSCLGSSWHWPGTSLVETYIDSSAIRKLSWVARQPFLPLQYISRNMIWLMIRIMILWLIIILISLPIGSKYGRFTYIFMRSFLKWSRILCAYWFADLWAIHGYSNWGERGFVDSQMLGESTNVPSLPKSFRHTLGLEVFSEPLKTNFKLRGA